MEVRPIAREDFEAVLIFCELMHQESPAYRDTPMDPEKLRQLGERMMAEPGRWCGLIALQSGRLVGMLAGFRTEPWFGRGCLAADLAVFVPPDRRGGVAATALIGRFEAWERQEGASAVQLGVSTGVTQDRTVRLYQRLGFEPFGVVCRKTIEGGT